MLNSDKQLHPSSTIGRLSATRNRLRNNLLSQLGDPHMTTVTFDCKNDVVYTGVYRVMQMGENRLKQFRDTSVELSIEDLVIEDIPRTIPIEALEGALVIFGIPPLTSRGEVKWIDARSLTHLTVLVKTSYQN